MTTHTTYFMYQIDNGQAPAEFFRKSLALARGRGAAAGLMLVHPSQLKAAQDAQLGVRVKAARTCLVNHCQVAR